MAIRIWGRVEGDIHTIKKNVVIKNRNHTILKEKTKHFETGAEEFKF